ncbi:MAG: hypothetical protein NT166_09800 [Candidatus Aminicenantes bacterium]|nr:hypothetical protein [Candidatus Aminicenantes bacterium]
MTAFEYYPPNTYNPKDSSGQYSPAGQLKSITDDKGNKTSYEYDDQNRIKKIVYPDSSVTEYSYDKEAGPTQNGDPVYYRVVTEKQRNGNVVKHYYDGLQRLIKNDITPAEGVDGTTLETFAYDGLSRLSSAVDDDAAIEYGYDPASRKTWGKQMGKLIEYTYDKVNNPLSVKYPNSRLIEREFDALSRIKKIREGASGIAEMNHIGRSFRLLSKQYGNGDLISYLYDNGRRLTGLESKNKNSDLINKYVYGYNRVGMKMFEQRVHDGNKGDAFSYDGVYRLTGVKFNSPEPHNPATTLFEKQKAINLDKVYNIISIVESQDGLTNTINTSIPEGSTYSKLNQYERFDQWGLSYDLNGNITQKGTQHFTYDYRNQLVRAVGVNTTTDFKYDPLGHRVKKIVSTGSQGKTSQYFYDGDQLIEERDGNDNVLKQYIYGDGIDEIIRMDKYEGATVTSYYFHTDANGSVTSITDKDGNLIERVTYDTYGMPTFLDPTGNVIPESLIGNTILFQGREYDKETNLYYYRARYYDPIMGRFLQNDPMGYQDSMNLYQGFNMNPVNFIDPFGTVIHEWKNLGVYGPASGRPDEPAPYTLPNYEEAGAYAALSDFINIEPVQTSDGKWTIRASFKMILLIWLTHEYKLEHEKAHVVQYMDLYIRILRFLEHMEDVGDRKPYETRALAQAAIDRMAGKDYSEIKKMTIVQNPLASSHDKLTRVDANKIIDETNYFEMKKPTDPPFKVRKFKNVKTWVDYILGTKEESKDEK